MSTYCTVCSPCHRERRTRCRVHEPSACVCSDMRARNKGKSACTVSVCIRFTVKQRIAVEAAGQRRPCIAVQNETFCVSFTAYTHTYQAARTAPSVCPSAAAAPPVARAQAAYSGPALRARRRQQSHTQIRAGTISPNRRTDTPAIRPVQCNRRTRSPAGSMALSSTAACSALSTRSLLQPCASLSNPRHALVPRPANGAGCVTGIATYTLGDTCASAYSAQPQRVRCGYWGPIHGAQSAVMYPAMTIVSDTQTHNYT